MSRERLIVRFDGPYLRDHQMDVEQLAPSLIGLASLCRRANILFNQDRTSVRLYINADSEQKCFQFYLEVSQHILDAAKSLLLDEKISTAQEILIWLGIINGGGVLAAGGVKGLYALLKFLKGRKPDKTEITIRDGRNVANLTVGDQSIVVFSQTYQMYQDAETIKNAKKFTAPVTHEGYDRVEFEQDGKVSEAISNEDARLIKDTPEPERQASTILGASKIRANVRIRRAVYEGMGKWTIQYDRAREMTMADSDWLHRFQTRQELAPPGSILDVDMIMSPIELGSVPR
jgi:hypothetical protein